MDMDSKCAPPTTTVYFDSSTYDHADKSIGVDASDIKLVERAFASGAYSLEFGVHVLEEWMRWAARSAPDRQQTLGQIQLARRWVNPKRIFRQHRDLAMEAVIAAFSGSRLPEPFEYREDYLCGALEDLLSSDGEAAEAERRRLSSWVDERISEFNDLILSTAPELMEAWSSKRRGATIEAKSLYFYEQRLKSAVSFARTTRFAPITPEVVERILATPFTKGYCEAAASLLCSYRFDGRRVDAGDSRDLMHAALAAHTQIFVTEDARFAKVLKRIPARGYEVMSLPEFVHAVRACVGTTQLSGVA
ncbi:MAG: hypothetical protein HZB25_03950 [Candidatus Eisenbacteria bacterium]|nr:hypothetical protein [Candidatus Eisenbacteria bacterium]